MPSFLSDPTTGLYLVLVLVPVVAAVPLARYQDRKNLVRFLACCGPLLVVVLIDWLVESPREEANRKVRAMAAAATRADPAAFVEHLSPAFRMNNKGRDEVRASPAWDRIRGEKAEVSVNGFSHDTSEWVSDSEFEVGFFVRCDAPGRSGFLARYCKARFGKDPDGQYRLRGIKFYDPANRGLNAEEPIPGFP